MAHDNPPPAQQQQQQTLNIPSLIFVLLILAFSIHYFFFSSASTSASSTSSNPSSQRRNRNAADPAQIEQIASMFPQLSRRDIQWDLQRNGGSVQATTERVLSGRGLERPPPSFQPMQLPATMTPNVRAPSMSSSKSAHPDLITRYKLESRISPSSSSAQQQQQQAESEGPAWRQ
ncbi:MAG: hypothetical protein Q9194_007463, partial [Teloschistes cf. exilis]